jgi:Peptidase_C39 like family
MRVPGRLCTKEGSVNCRFLLTMLSALLLAACGFPHSLPNAPLASSTEIGAAGGRALDIPPRKQWNANFGYCGETSMISAGLYYGQYVSQYTARAVASDDTPQYKRKSQLLLGGNDRHAANEMHLAWIEWNTASEQSTDQFLRWVRRNVERGYPVAIGVYTNEYRFYGDKAPRAGDPAYDHIVPVTSVSSDSLTFSDNGLWDPASKPHYTFGYSFAAFQRSRVAANKPSAPVYSLANDAQNYGIAIGGVADADRETLPVRISTNVPWERPPMKNGSNVRPRPMPLTLTIAVSNLTPGVVYRLYRYDSLDRIPNAHFNANASKASASWRIRITSGSTYTMTQAIMSDRVAAYRAVAASAP